MAVKSEEVNKEILTLEINKTKGSVESIEDRKNRIYGLWSNWQETRKIPELMNLVDRKSPYTANESPENLLKNHKYPSRTTIPELKFGEWEVNLESKFIKDGYMYLLRGDYPNLEKKGFYSRPYGYAKKTAKQLTQDLQSSDEVGYFLYGQEAYLKTVKPSSDNIADELAHNQSQRGGSSFISTTTNLDCAISGTGNQPDKEEQKNYEIYILKIPTEYVINSNTGNFYGMEEDEYLIPDCVYPSEVIAKFSRNEGNSVYEFLHKELGIDREDLGMSKE